MGNITITTNDQSPSCILENPKYREDTLLFSAADTWAQNTILARLLVSNTMTVVITRAGSSTSEATAASTAGKTAQVGAYVITAGTMGSGAGTWTLVAPDGTVEVFTSEASTDDLVFPSLTLTVTEAGTPAVWDTGDVITVTTTAQSGTPLVLYDVDGVNGAQVPVAILPYESVQTAGGSFAASVLVGGVVRKDKLVIDADGDSTNVTDHVMDLLANAGITVLLNTDVSVLDNGAS